MDPYDLAIPIAFILLAAVVCLVLIGAKWKWWQKFALIVIVPTFGLAVWSAIGSYKGWPTPQELPMRAQVVWIHIQEPEPKQEGRPGAIYLWLIPMDDSAPDANLLDFVPPDGVPRAYRHRYIRPLHEASDEARRRLLSGQPVILDRRGVQGGEQGADGEDGYGYDAERQDFQLYVLPPPQAPGKLPE